MRRASPSENKMLLFRLDQYAAVIIPPAKQTVHSGGINSRAVVLSDLLAQDENLLVPLHLLGHGLVQRIANGHLLDAAGRGISSLHPEGGHSLESIGLEGRACGRASTQSTGEACADHFVRNR